MRKLLALSTIILACQTELDHLLVCKPRVFTEQSLFKYTLSGSEPKSRVYPSLHNPCSYLTVSIIDDISPTSAGSASFIENLFEVPEQANPTDPTEGPTDQPPEVPDQADPTDPTDGPTNQSPQQEQERPTDPEMSSDNPTDEPPTVPPVAKTTALSSIF